MYYHGEPACEIEKDLARAAELFRVAAGNNDPEAQRCLAKMYEAGEGGLEMDLEEAEILEAAADNDGVFVEKEPQQEQERPRPRHSREGKVRDEPRGPPSPSAKRAARYAKK